MSQLKRILAVDDEPHMRRLLEISLRQAGYAPLVAENGREALNILRDNNVDLVVSDLHMPVMDGLKLLEAMRKDNIDTPVIIVTAQGEIASAVQAMKHAIASASDVFETSQKAVKHAVVVVEEQIVAVWSEPV